MSEENHDPRHYVEHEGHQVVPIRTYLAVFATLAALLYVTVQVAFIPLGYFNLPVALTIAVAKAVLIVLFFMHVKYGTRLVWVFATSSFLFLIIMFGLSLSDYTTRGWMPGQ